MKPLPVLTEEDWCIWLRLRAGQFDSSSDDTWLEVVDAYEASDRRDAELMLSIEQIRACAEFKLEHIVYMLLRGWLYCDTIGIAKV
jgi:hypothetical protein